MDAGIIVTVAAALVAGTGLGYLLGTSFQSKRSGNLLGSAMQGYITASRDLLAAASATGAQRTELLAQASAAGKAADATYDKAVAAIAALRAELDLPTDWSG